MDSRSPRNNSDLLGLRIGDGTAQILKLVIARTKAGRGNVPA